MDFEKINPYLNDAIKLAYFVLKKGGAYPLVFNTSNEVAVNSFLKKEIKFLDIIKIIKKILISAKKYNIKKIDDIYHIDKVIRMKTNNYINNCNGNVK